MVPYGMFMDSRTYSKQSIRVAALERVCIPMLHNLDRITLSQFFGKSLLDLKSLLSVKEPRVCILHLDFSIAANVASV